MKTRVVVLGAGFGGLELCTHLSDELGGDVGVTLIDRNDSFVFGYSKLDVMFGRAAPSRAVAPAISSSAPIAVPAGLSGRR